jgi:hypothetical protein
LQPYNTLRPTSRGNREFAYNSPSTSSDRILGKAHLKRAAAEVAVSGLHKTGVFLVKRNNFNEHEFMWEIYSN